MGNSSVRETGLRILFCLLAVTNIALVELYLMVLGYKNRRKRQAKGQVMENKWKTGSVSWRLLYRLYLFFFPGCFFLRKKDSKFQR